MKVSSIIKVIMVGLPLAFSSCGTHKAIVSDSAQNTVKQQITTTDSKSQKLIFLQKVSDNQVYAKNIVGNMTFHLEAGSKSVTLPASLHMRKDQVVRIQLMIPILGSEVGRLEFTPDHVLIVDRMHKEYIQARYDEVDFLKRQGINFYSLQALFWNQLLLPGNKEVSESDLSKFTVGEQNTSSSLVPISYKNGEMLYTWNAESGGGQIKETQVTYNSKQNGKSVLLMKYSDFRNVGVKQFPASQSLQLSTQVGQKQQKMQVNMELDEVTTKSDWKVETEISSKYKKVAPEDVIGKLMKL